MKKLKDENYNHFLKVTSMSLEAPGLNAFTVNPSRLSFLISMQIETQARAKWVAFNNQNKSKC